MEISASVRNPNERNNLHQGRALLKEILIRWRIAVLGGRSRDNKTRI